MSEIELIDFCEEHFTDYAVCKALKCEELCKDDDCPLVRVFNGYRAALREKVERSKGCVYCINSPKKIFAEKERYSLATETGLTCDAIKVIFCPACGKRLDVEP